MLQAQAHEHVSCDHIFCTSNIWWKNLHPAPAEKTSISCRSPVVAVANFFRISSCHNYND